MNAIASKGDAPMQALVATSSDWTVAAADRANPFAGGDFGFALLSGFRAWRRLRRYRRTMRELHALSPQQLAEHGIPAEAIARLAYEATRA